MKGKKIFSVVIVCVLGLNAHAQELFPNGTPVSPWFYQVEPTNIHQSGNHYRITDYGVVNDSTLLQTEKIQAVIDQAASSGGGVVIIPSGTYLSGSLFFKPGTHLHLEKNGTLKGSDDISHFPLVTTRVEGQTLTYFAALVNADKMDGFTISGEGTIDGNGLRYWRAFWLRRKFNPQCTNMDEMRPRLIYISNSKNIQLSDVALKNSPFWTTHLYKCRYVKLLNLHISSPASPVKAPSTDAIDLDVCNHVLIKGCYMSVNDDAVVLKGGKGPYADQDENNGENYNIIIEDCTYGFCHSALTCGSESIHSYNIIFRNSTVDKVQRLLQLKMRPDTPQKYEHILLDRISGNAGRMIVVRPWTQFFDLKGEKDIRLSYANHIRMQNVQLECETAFDIVESDQYKLSDFTFSGMNIKAKQISVEGTEMIDGLRAENTVIGGRKFSGELAKTTQIDRVNQWDE
jgi:Endopolygalacturonase